MTYNVFSGTLNLTQLNSLFTLVAGIQRFIREERE